MNNKRISLITVIAIVAVSSIGCSNWFNKKEPNTVAEEEILIPSDSSLVEEIWVYFTGDVQKNMKLAETSIANKDTGATLYSIGKATALMELEAQRASGKDREDLLSSIDKMQKLAGDIRNDKSFPGPEYQTTFAEAQLSLGRFHLAQAEYQWKHKNYYDTGKELEEAAHNLDYAFLWKDRKTDDNSNRDLSTIRHVSSQLIQNEDWDRRDVERALKLADEQVIKINRKLSS
jgi:hypothetical protein